MNDRIVILEDTDHDGRADKSTIFAGDLHNPTPVSDTHLRAHETNAKLVCRPLLEKKKNKKNYFLQSYYHTLLGESMLELIDQP